MKLPFLPLLFSLPLLIGATAPDPNREDVRCFAVIVPLASSDKPEMKQAGLFGSFYFLARIDGRSPNFDLETSLRREAMAIAASTPADRKSLGQNCLAVMQKRFVDLQTIVEHLPAHSG